MDGRISFWLLTVSVTVLCAGCTTTTSQKTNGPPLGASVRPEDAPIIKKAEGPKRNASPATEIAYGKMKEMEADSEALKSQPEARAALRDQARKAYQKAAELDKNNLDGQRCLARLYTKMGDFDRAQTIYVKALEKNPKDAGLWYDFGLCHSRRKGGLSEAVRCFNKAIELDPENREYLKRLGYSLAWMGQVDQGLAYLTRANQSAALAHFDIACMYDQKEQPEQAIHHLRLALRENSQLIQAQDLLEALERPDGSRLQRGSLESPVTVR